jgi:TonB-linked SusC/RagA family outer membrane protein
MKQVLFVLLVLFGSISMTFGQRTVSGKVTDPTGETVIGANVVVKEVPTVGTITDIDGMFELSIPANGTTLVISYTGFETKEIAIGSSDVINITLSEGKLLEEVVVTGLAIKKEKRALGYAVTTINKELIVNRPEGDVSRILQGKIPGVNITSTGGVSGTGTNIIIRGYSSVTGSNQPLWVVDGIPFNSGTNQGNNFAQGGVSASSRMLDLDPNNVESVSVLKGLSATVLYGDQGRNGVILVTTKSGATSSKNAELNFSQSYFQNTIASLPDYQDNYGGGFQQLTPESWFFSNWGANFKDLSVVPHPVGLSGIANIRNNFPQFAIDPNKPWGSGTQAQRDNVVRYDNKAYPNVGESFFRTGNVLQTSLQIGGSTDKSSYTASLGYMDEQGFTVGNNLKKINLGLGYSAALSSKLSLRSAFNYARTGLETPPLNAGFGSGPNGGIPSAFANVLYTPRNVDLANLPFENPVDRSSVYYRGGNDITNPNWLVRNMSNTSDVNRFFTSNTLSYAVNDKLGILYRFGLDTYSENQETKYNKGHGNPDVAASSAIIQSGFYQTTGIQNTILNHDVNVSYKTNFSDDLLFTGIVGGNYRTDDYEQFGLASSGQLAFGLFNHSNFTNTSSRNPFSNGRLAFVEQQSRAGLYGSFTLDYKDYLYVNLLARNDWTSTVEKDNARILYPGASVSFIPTTAFGIDNNVLKYLKVRVGYGTSAGFPSPYNTRNILAQNTREFLVGANPLAGQTIGNALGNPNLKPELQKELEGGIEANLFNNKVKLDLSVYARTTSNLITESPLDPATGYTRTFINLGGMKTNGIDLGLTVTPVSTASGFQWDATINYGHYRSTITELAAGLDKVLIGGFTNLGNYAKVDKPYGIIEGIGIERDANGNKIVQATGRYLPTAGNVELGDPNPRFTSSLLNMFSYKGFSLGANIEYRHKGVIISNTVKGVLARGLSKDTDQLDRELSLVLPGVQADGTPNNVQITAANYFFDNYFFTDEAITFDGSTLRLREVTLSYAIPASVLGKSPFKRATFNLNASNLWFRALNMPKFVNFDTDVLSTGVGNTLGFDYLTGPSARRIGGTLNLTF